MKFTTIAIIKIEDDLREIIRKDLSEQSKTYVSEDMKTLVSALLEESHPNITDDEMAVAVSEMNGTETGVDEKGVFELTYSYKEALINESVKKIEKVIRRLDFCDGYSAFDMQMTDDLLESMDSFERFPDSVITPECRLVRAPQAFMFMDEKSSNYKDFLNWKVEMKKILKEYSGNSLCLLLACHA
jgi:hypothetical protein